MRYRTSMRLTNSEGNDRNQITMQGNVRISEKFNLIRDISTTNKEVSCLHTNTDRKLTLPPHSSDSSDFKKCNNFTESDGSRDIQKSPFLFNYVSTKSSNVMPSKETKPVESHNYTQRFKSVPLDEEILKIKFHIE